MLRLAVRDWTGRSGVNGGCSLCESTRQGMKKPNKKGWWWRRNSSNKQLSVHCTVREAQGPYTSGCIPKPRVSYR